MKKTIAERLWAKVEKGQGADDCWVWVGATNEGNYGMISVCGKPTRAHRVSWELHNNRPIPHGMIVCHTCDNTLCVRPDHLFLGSPYDNVIDMLHKKRSGRQVMTEEVVKEIRAEYATGRSSYADLALLHKTTEHTVWRVVNGKTWKHLAGGVRHMKQLTLPGIT